MLLPIFYASLILSHSSKRNIYQARLSGAEPKAQILKSLRQQDHKFKTSLSKSEDPSLSGKIQKDKE